MRTSLSSPTLINAVLIDLKSVARACRSHDYSFPKDLSAFRSAWCHQRAQNRTGRWEPFERNVSSAGALWTIRAQNSKTKALQNFGSRYHWPSVSTSCTGTDPGGALRKASRSALQYQTSGPPTAPFNPEGCSALHLGASLIALIRFTLAVTRTCKKQQRYPQKRKPGTTRPNSDEAGATPPFDAPCDTASVGSLPPRSRAARDPFSRVPEPEL